MRPNLEKMATINEPCSICGQTIGVDTNGWTGGHNAQPINDGRCCESCNWNVVLPERFSIHNEKINKETDDEYERLSKKNV